MAESAKNELHLSDTALGIIQGAGAALPLVLFSVPSGVLVDRFNRVRLLIFMAAVWTAGTFLTAVAGSAELLFAARMITGIGTTGALTASLSLTSDLCRPEQRGRGMLINALFKSFGQAAAFAVSGALLGYFALRGAPGLFGETVAWRNSQLVLAIGSAVLILPLLFLREPPRHEVEAGPKAPFRQVLGELWVRRGFLIPLFVGQVGIVMADAAAGIWVSPVLERDYHLKPAEFGGWLGLTLLAAGIVGSIIGGLLADWGQKSGRKGGLLIGALGAAIVGVPTALFPVMPDVTSFGFMVGMLLLTGTITGLITSVALTVYLPNELRGLSIGLFIAIAGLIGFGIAPSLVTLVSGLLGGEAMLGKALAMVGVTVSLISVLAFALAIGRAPASIHAAADAG
jgi:MFS family permease